MLVSPRTKSSTSTGYFSISTGYFSISTGYFANSTGSSVTTGRFLPFHWSFLYLIFIHHAPKSAPRLEGHDGPEPLAHNPVKSCVFFLGLFFPFFSSRCGHEWTGINSSSALPFSPKALFQGRHLAGDPQKPHAGTLSTLVLAQHSCT